MIYRQVTEEFDIIVEGNLVQEASTSYAGRQFSDYVLLGKEGKPLAVIEAKKTHLAVLSLHLVHIKSNHY